MPLWLARLTGAQPDMGAQHGRLAGDEARRLLAFYRSMPERVLVGGAPGAGGVVARCAVRALSHAWQARLVRDRPAALLARSRAYVEAVDLREVDAGMRALATMDSLQNCVALAARGGLGPFDRKLIARATAAAVPACSTVIAWGDATANGELLFARNFDFPGVGVWDVAPAFVVCAPDRGQRYGFFTAKGGDAPVVTVVNEAGLVFAPHTRWHRGVTWRGAMIVDVIHELARRAETLADAIAIAREYPASSTWGIAIGSAREQAALVLELAGPQLEVVRPAPGASTLVCNNHYRTPSLVAGELAASAAWGLHSQRRERRLTELAAERPLTPRKLVAMLGDRRDPAAPDRERHLGAIVAQPTNVHSAVVEPAAMRAWVGIDRAPCCEGQWAEVGWSWDGPAGGWTADHDGVAPASRFRVAPCDLARPHAPATLHVREAVRAYEHDHDVSAARAAIERAVALAPADPSLRLSAAWLALADGARDRAIVHVHAGLGEEVEAYRRGQLLLWGSRAAAGADPELAKRWRDELDRLVGDGVGELRTAGRRRYQGRPQVNLMMADAY